MHCLHTTALLEISEGERAKLSRLVNSRSQAERDLKLAHADRLAMEQVLDALSRPETVGQRERESECRQTKTGATSACARKSEVF